MSRTRNDEPSVRYVLPRVSAAMLATRAEVHPAVVVSRPGAPLAAHGRQASPGSAGADWFGHAVFMIGVALLAAAALFLAYSRIEPRRLGFHVHRLQKEEVEIMHRRDVLTSALKQAAADGELERRALEVGMSVPAPAAVRDPRQRVTLR